MIRALFFAAAVSIATAGAGFAQEAPTDPQIAHIAYTAGQLDVAAAQQALLKSSDAAVRDFADLMIRDHQAVNDQALALVQKLGVTPEDNPTSQALTTAANAKLAELDALEGAAFDSAYVANEVAFHQTVNDALATVLIPAAQNADLKALLETGLTLFTAHQQHAEHLAAEVK